MSQMSEEVANALTRASIARAIEIGNDLLAIEEAIEQAKTAWTNKHLGESRYSFYDQPVFEALAAHREGLRKELLSLDFPGVK